MSPKPRIEWNDSNISTASKLWSSDKTVSDLAKYFDVSRSTISGMIMRNREKFPERRKTGPKQPKWAEEKIAYAVKLWDDGLTLRKMAALLGVATSVVHWVVNSNRARFAPRKSGRPAHSAVRKTYSDETVFGFIGNPETQASERYDFTQYQIEGTEPVAYWMLKGCQCHFPLERFEDKSGPETPCCGQKTIEGRSYCNTHWKLMHEGGRE